MKLLLMLVFGAISAVSQPFGFGVKGGVPLTDFVSAIDTGTLRFNTAPNRYIVGPTIELRLPFGFGIEVDALYRHLQYSSTQPVGVVVNDARTTGDAWEFPILAKYRLPTKVVRPYVDGGVAFDALAGLKQTLTQTVLPTRAVTTTVTSNPAELNNNATVGVVVGLGVDVHALILHISPEIRYTRWSTQHLIAPNGLLESNQNQAEFLVGITF